MLPQCCTRSPTLEPLYDVKKIVRKPRVFRQVRLIWPKCDENALTLSAGIGISRQFIRRCSLVFLTRLATLFRLEIMCGN